MNKARSDRDLMLKYLCKILFNELGYISILEIKLRTKSYIQTLKMHDVSDIDVYGYSFHSDMTYNLIGAECKSGESNALDELYKFFGVMKYVGINRGYFIKTKIHQNARQIASEKNLLCFTEAELRQFLLNCNIDIEKQIKIEKAKYGRLNSALMGYKKINSKIIDYISYEYWNRENWRNIHNIIHLLKLKQGEDFFPETNILEKYMCYYFLELFSLATLKNISKAMLLSYSDIDNAIKIALYGGSESLSEKQKIYDLVSQELKKDVSFSPEWESDFINLSSRFALHSKHSSKVVQTLNEIRENCFFSDKIRISSKLLRNYSDLTRKFTQDLMQFLVKYTSIDKNIFKEFMGV